MQISQRTYRPRILKITCLVIGLALMAAQCSYKFYTFSSFLPVRIAQQRAQSKDRLPKVRSTRDYRPFLSLDKRFDHPNPYLPSTNFTVGVPVLQASAEPPISLIQALLSKDARSNPRRGPPTIA